MLHTPWQPYQTIQVDIDAPFAAIAVLAAAVATGCRAALSVVAFALRWVELAGKMVVAAAALMTQVMIQS